MHPYVIIIIIIAEKKAAAISDEYLDAHFDQSLTNHQDHNTNNPHNIVTLDSITEKEAAAISNVIQTGSPTSINIKMPVYTDFNPYI